MGDEFPRFIPVPLDLSDGPVPLSRWEDGSVRVTNSRVPLYMVIHKFQWGETPEEVAKAFDTVELEYAYAIKAFYERHRDAVDAYVAEIDRQADAVQRYPESQSEYQAFMARFKAKIEARKMGDHASSAR